MGRPFDLSVPSDHLSANPGADEVLAHVKNILESAIFIQSERLRRFLQFTVEHTLEGHADRIKEYTLGIEVFDRDPTYDPRVDSIVRVEARRLRRKLKEYYQQSGFKDSVLIEFPPGGYVPVFRRAPAAAPQALPSASAALPIRTLDPNAVAVLPFLDLSPDSDLDFFCDGLTEEILNTLATIPSLRVVARTSVFHFRDRNPDIRKIGEQLGAGILIEGSVRKNGTIARISAKAVDASTGLLRWSGTFDREFEDLFAVQDEIARAIAQGLRVFLAPQHSQVIRGRRDLEAYTAYLKGRHYWNHVAQEGVQAALNEFNRSLTLFPTYAPAHAGLANIYTHLAFWNVIPPAEGIWLAKRSAIEALRLDKDSAGAYCVLGLIHSCCEWNWSEGERELLRAIDLSPSNMTARTYYCLHLLCQGRFKELETELNEAFQLDPISPWSFRNQGWYYYFGGEYDKAIGSMQTALTLDPGFREAQFILAYAYLRQARFQEALEVLLALPEGPFAATRLGALGECYGAAGDRHEAEHTLEELTKLADTQYVSPLNRMAVHAGMGDWDRALEDLQLGYVERSPWLSLIKVDPRWKPVHKDPRYLKILAAMHLEEQTTANSGS